MVSQFSWVRLCISFCVAAHGVVAVAVTSGAFRGCAADDAPRSSWDGLAIVAVAVLAVAMVAAVAGLLLDAGAWIVGVADRRVALARDGSAIVVGLGPGARLVWGSAEPSSSGWGGDLGGVVPRRVAAYSGLAAPAPPSRHARTVAADALDRLVARCERDLRHVEMPLDRTWRVRLSGELACEILPACAALLRWGDGRGGEPEADSDL